MYSIHSFIHSFLKVFASYVFKAFHFCHIWGWPLALGCTLTLYISLPSYSSLRCHDVVSVLLLWLMSGVVLQSAGYRRCNIQRNICYEFHNQAVSHNDADASCREHHGQLATILNNQTQQYIQLLSGGPNSQYWLGGKLHIQDLSLIHIWRCRRRG